MFSTCLSSLKNYSHFCKTTLKYKIFKRLEDHNFMVSCSMGRQKKNRYLTATNAKAFAKPLHSNGEKKD
jgi:hypothetical protein